MSFLSLGLDQPVARLGDTITGDLESIGARCVMDGTLSSGRFSLVEHPIRPRGLAAPMHLHTREDEYSFVLEGRWGFQLADEIVYADPGDLGERYGLRADLDSIPGLLAAHGLVA
jgi:hypothetical protein